MTARTQLHQIIAELTIISHVSAANLEPGAPGAEESIGGRRPPGGIDRKDDRDPDILIKSADHFAARARKCRTDRDYQAVLEDAKATLEAWKRTPVRNDPEWGSFAWKRKIVREIEASTDKKAAIKEAVRLYSISQATIYRYLAAYGQDLAA